MGDLHPHFALLIRNPLHQICRQTEKWAGQGRRESYNSTLCWQTPVGLIN